MLRRDTYQGESLEQRIARAQRVLLDDTQRDLAIDLIDWIGNDLPYPANIEAYQIKLLASDRSVFGSVIGVRLGRLTTLQGEVKKRTRRAARRLTGDSDLGGKVYKPHPRWERARKFSRSAHKDYGSYVQGERSSLRRVVKEFVEARGDRPRCDACPTVSVMDGDVRWEVDHIEPLVARVKRLVKDKPDIKGGINTLTGEVSRGSFYWRAFLDPSNMQLLCSRCHRLKTSSERLPR